MDEILLSNFMVFHDLVRDEQYDLWIGDEAWELDYYLHENPEQKRTPYVWLTDFVGWLPMADGGDHEAFLTGDYNEEMIEHIARLPRVRDQAVFVGNPEDIVPERFAPHLPWIREWTEEHFSFAGYVTGFDPAEFADRAALRDELGYRDDEQVCIVTVGGSGVGGDLLRRVIAAFPEAKQRVPALRMIVVAGPRIPPETLPAHDGLEVRTYVHDLYRHLAACDLAVVQGGLTTSMELTANRRPFLYFPLRHHFEQNLHVRNRLDRYGAGRRMDFEQETPETIAAAIAETIGQEVDYRPVEADGAAQAAALIAPLLEETKGRRGRHARAAGQPPRERNTHAPAARQARLVPRLTRRRRCRRRRRSSSTSPASTRAPASRRPTSSPSSTPRRDGSSTRLPMPNVGDELHHFGWNRCSSACHGPDRSHLIVPGFRSSRIHIVNVADDPRRPRIEKVIEPEEIVAKTGYTRPHTVHCMPGDNVVVSMLGDADGNGAGGFAVLDAKTFEVKGRWENGGETPPFNYDFWYQPRKNVLVSSEFGEPNAYEKGFDLADVEAGRYGQRLHFWNLDDAEAASRRSTSARTGWSRSRCAGSTTPTPSRASSARRSRA